MLEFSADCFRKAGISQATFYAWRKKYAGMTPSEMRRLKALERENCELRQANEILRKASAYFAMAELDCRSK